MTQDRTSSIIPTTGRRRLGAALLAISGGSVLTSGIAAGVAASVSDTPAAGDADARLIAICAAAEAADDHSMAVWDGTEDLPFGDERVQHAFEECQRIYEGCRAGIAQAITIPAITAAGMQAKASLALREMWRDDEEEIELPLVRSILLQLAGRA